MKKRIVAIMLSLTMCLSMAAEASAASEAEFVAETDVSDDSEAVVADDAEEAVVIDADDADAEDAQVDVDADENADTENTDAADAASDNFDVFSSEETEIQLEDQDEPAAAADISAQAVSEVVKAQEASLLYTRWKSENGKWKLEKPATAVQTVADDADAVAVENAAEDDAVSVDEDVQGEENTEVSEETLDVAALEEETTEETPDAQDAAASEEETSEDAQDEATAVQASAGYFTDKDGIVKVSTLKNDGSVIYTAYYAFDANGYLITGRSKISNAYYYFKTSGEVKVAKDIDTSKGVTPYNSELGQRVTDTWKWNTTDQAFNHYGKDGKQETIAANKIYTINGESYFLLDGGKPYVGMRTVDKAVYNFRKASGANDIPGKMVHKAWASASTSKGTVWRYYGADGKYQKKGIGAYKVLTNSNNLYLLDADGYLIKGKMVKAANKAYYLADKNGVVYQNKLVKYGKYRYYFVGNGKRATWKNRWMQCKGADNRYYYFGKNAGQVVEKKGIQKVVVKGKFIGYYYFAKNGNSVAKQWVGDRFFKADGKMASGLTKIGRRYYFFQRSDANNCKGKMYRTQWIRYNGKYYCASSKGILYANGWRRLKCGDQKYYFYFKDCVALTNRKIKRGDTYGTLDSRGRFVEAGWVVINSGRNLVRYMDPATGKYVKNAVKVINGIQYRFDKNGYRVNDRTKEIKRSKYYLSCDRVNGVMTVYADKARTIPIKTIRVSVGKAETPTPKGTYKITRAGRWQQLMGPSWGQYGSWVVGGIYVHSVACSQMNDHNLPTGAYLMLGNPASHGCIRCCVADAKWVYDNCNGSEINIFDGVYKSDETAKGPLGRNPLTPLRGAKNFDPTDPAYN